MVRIAGSQAGCSWVRLQRTPDELCLNVMFTESGELRSRHSGGVAGGEVDVHQHHVPEREGAEAACIVPTA